MFLQILTIDCILLLFSYEVEMLLLPMFVHNLEH